jgi:hypothetical protein
MAKGGGRKYNRDKNGKFASTGGARLGGKKKTSENLGQRGLGTSAPRGTIPRFAESRMMAGKNQRFAGKSSKAAPPAAAKPAAKAAPKAPAKSRDRRASQMAAADVNNRRLEGRKLSGKGKTPMARANRNLERAMTTPSKNRVRSERVARAAIDHYAATGGGGKRKRGKK